MSKKAARKGDIGSAHQCFPPTPTTAGSPNVLINNRPAIRVGDPLLLHGCGNCPPHPRATAQGSASVLINGLPACRVGDDVDCGGVIITGSGNVLIGEYQAGDEASETDHEGMVGSLEDSVQTQVLKNTSSAFCEICHEEDSTASVVADQQQPFQHENTLTQPPLITARDDTIALNPLYRQLAFDPFGISEQENAYKHPQEAEIAHRLFDLALDLAKEIVAKRYEKKHKNDKKHKLKAVLSTLWNILMTKNMGIEKAKQFADAKARYTLSSEGEIAMELYNNALGRALALNSDASEKDPSAQIQQLLTTDHIKIKPFTITQAHTPNWQHYD